MQILVMTNWRSFVNATYIHANSLGKGFEKTVSIFSPIRLLLWTINLGENIVWVIVLQWPTTSNIQLVVVAVSRYEPRCLSDIYGILFPLRPRFLPNVGCQTHEMAQDTPDGPSLSPWSPSLPQWSPATLATDDLR